MTNTSIRVASSLILLLFVAFGIDLTHVQAAGDRDKQVALDRVEFDTIKPEKLGSPRSGSMGSRDNKWILVEFSYEVRPDPDAKEKTNFLDEVTFKVSVEGRLTDGGFNANDAKVAILTGEVTYVAVPIGKGFGSLYISPDVAAYYHITANMSQCNINVQAVVGGQVVDSKDKRREKAEDENWFARSDYKIVPGMLYLKNQSPFILNDTDRYPTIKIKQ